MFQLLFCQRFIVYRILRFLRVCTNTKYRIICYININLSTLRINSILIPTKMPRFRFSRKGDIFLVKINFAEIYLVTCIVVGSSLFFCMSILLRGLICDTLCRSNHQRCSVKNVFLKL